jgi:hypothetical protein
LKIEGKEAAMPTIMTEEAPVVENKEPKKQRPSSNAPPMPDRSWYQRVTDDDRTAWKGYLLTQKGDALRDHGVAMFEEADVWTISRVLRNPHLRHTLMNIPSVKDAAKRRIIRLLSKAGSALYGMDFMDRCRVEKDILEDKDACQSALQGIAAMEERLALLTARKRKFPEDQEEAKQLRKDLKKACKLFKPDPETPP